MNIRIGFGVDVHQLADTHELFIGGKKIESDLDLTVILLPRESNI